MTVNEELLAEFERTRNPVYRIYEPPEVCVVMGAGRQGKGDVLEERALADGVSVLVRKGGGGTVVLSPGMVVLALVTEAASPYRNKEYAAAVNLWFVEALERLGVTGITQRGISDVALGDTKILGTSIFRRRNILFYQASLLVSNDISLFGRYLTFPSLVPDYRAGRDHERFCTTLHTAGHRLPVARVMAAVDEVVTRRMSELCSPT